MPLLCSEDRGGSRFARGVCINGQSRGRLAACEYLLAKSCSMDERIDVPSLSRSLAHSGMSCDAMLGLLAFQDDQT